MKFISIDTSGKFCSISISLSNNIQESIISTTPLSHSAELAVNVKKIIDKYYRVSKIYSSGEGRLADE